MHHYCGHLCCKLVAGVNLNGILVSSMHWVGDVCISQAQQQLGKARMAADNLFRQFPQFGIESFPDCGVGFVGLVRR